MNKDFKNKNFVILILNGERCDKVGLNPTFHKNDPELTEKGKKQAYTLGEKISDYLAQKFPHHSKININTSPFASTIQTNLKLIKGMRKNNYFENKINLNYDLSEIVLEDFFEHPEIDSFLVV